MIRRCWAAALFLALFGCRHEVREGERLESFRPFQGARVGDLSLLDFSSRRAALFVSGRVPEGGERTADGWSLRLGLKEGETPTLGLGTAIPLTREGHFLTAAHNLGVAPYAVALLKDGAAEFAKATVVWAGNPAIPEEDFAVVKAALRPADVIDWDEAADLQPGLELASISAVHGPCGGRLRESSWYRNPRIPCPVLSVIHDLPGLQGDSGGPVFGRDGRFVGMNVLQKGNLTASPEGQAIRPDRRWILSVVAAVK